jgi:hypothetical protein
MLLRHRLKPFKVMIIVEMGRKRKDIFFLE